MYVAPAVPDPRSARSLILPYPAGRFVPARPRSAGRITFGRTNAPGVDAPGGSGSHTVVTRKAGATAVAGAAAPPTATDGRASGPERP
ncbi:hypothetical protein ADK58_16390 [Streptomyces sp. XY152]|nr:hypothetical protein ADK58_16390 [Streptomyces sp. XY152]